MLRVITNVFVEKIRNFLIQKLQKVKEIFENRQYLNRKKYIEIEKEVRFLKFVFYQTDIL